MTIVDTRMPRRPARQIEKHHRGRCSVQSYRFDSTGYICQGCAAYFGSEPPTGRIELGHREGCAGEVDRQDQLCPICSQRISVQVDPGVAVERPSTGAAPRSSPDDPHKVADVWTADGPPERRVEVARGRWVDFRAGHARLTTAAEVIFFMAKPGYRVDIASQHADWVSDWANQAQAVKADVRVDRAHLEGEPGAYRLVREDPETDEGAEDGSEGASAAGASGSSPVEWVPPTPEDLSAQSPLGPRRAKRSGRKNKDEATA